MKQKYINTVVYDVDDKLDQIFPHHKVPEDIKLKLVRKKVTELMTLFGTLMDTWELEGEDGSS